MEPWQMSAGEQAAAIAAGELTSVEVVQAHIDRIAAVNDKLNAVTTVLDSALADAAAADAARVAGAGLGPLHGVPFTIKENLDVAGSATTEGLVAYEQNVVDLDAPVVERMKAAGGVALARTNLPDLGLRVHTDSGLRGLTRNPHHQDRTAGGSSGGEASALSSGMSPIGLGNDIGGSLRNPAFCCGIASIKPGFGRVPSAAMTEPRSGTLVAQLMAVDGPMARTVADVRLGLEVLSGPHPRDPFSLPLAMRGPEVAKRVALVPEPEGGATDPGIAESVRRAGAALEAAGYEVEEIAPPSVAECARLWATWLGGETTILLPILETVMSGDALTFLENARSLWPEPDHVGAITTLTERHVVARAWSEFMAEWPIVVGPVWCQPPFTHGFDVESPDATAQVIELLRYVTPFNLLGLPAAVVGAGQLPDGMPAAVQVGTDRGREDLALDVAEVIEAAFGAPRPIDPRW